MRKRIINSAIVLGTSAMVILSPYTSIPTFATQPETIETVDIMQQNPDSENAAEESTEDFSSLSEEELAIEYQQYLHSLEDKESNPDTLTAEEEAAGYEIVDGVKKSPDELDGDIGNEVNFGGVIPGANTGYVNFFTELPEYIHENAYVIVMNLNTGEMFGCRTYEINNFQAQICLPAGIYMISEGGLSSDTTGRFYALSQQFQVKSGSQQTVVAQIADTHPELAEKAYPEDDADTENETSITKETTAANGTTEKEVKKSTETDKEKEKEEQKEAQGSLWQTIVLTIFFTVIPLALLVAAYLVTRKPKRGFDE